MKNESNDQRPLAGIRVLELTTAIAGPLCARFLAHFGAEVIKVESRTNPDTVRVMGSGWLSPEQYGREVWGDSNPALNEYNAGKKGLGLNLKPPECLEIIKRLLTRCDVFVSNLTPRAIDSLGLSFEAVRTAKPDIIYIQMTGYGATPGPYGSYLAFGKNLTALTGVDELTGWPDLPPAGIARIAFPDQTNALHGLLAVVSALDYRDRTGEGQSIDLSQFEATVGLLGPLLLDYEVNGQCAERIGNRAPWIAPQGVYPCRGHERWVAISVTTDSEWQALCQVAERPEWLDDPRFATVRGRLSHGDELDGMIAGWTRSHTNSEVSEWLQRAGVAAAPVLDYPCLAIDPQLAARDFWTLADHARFGPNVFTGVAMNLSETPGHCDQAGPAMGQDNDYVLRELAGCSAAEVEALIENGWLYPMVNPEIKLERPYARWLYHFMPQLPWPESEDEGV